MGLSKQGVLYDVTVFLSTCASKLSLGSSALIPLGHCSFRTRPAQAHLASLYCEPFTRRRFLSQRWTKEHFIWNIRAWTMRGTCPYCDIYFYNIMVLQLFGWKTVTCSLHSSKSLLSHHQRYNRLIRHTLQGVRK